LKRRLEIPIKPAVADGFGDLGGMNVLLAGVVGSLLAGMDLPDPGRADHQNDEDKYQGWGLRVRAPGRTPISVPQFAIRAGTS
jgi:hypothetical protein